MNRLLRILASPRLTLGVLAFLVLYSGFSAWAPDTSLRTIFGPRPFSAPLFLAAVILLFLCTLACTWFRAGKVLSLWRGEVPAAHVELVTTRRPFLEEFLREQGFRGEGEIRWRYRPALWAGWMLHLSLLVLMVGVVIQLAFHDGGAFEVAQGETVSLAEPGTVFARTPGTFAADRPPDLRVLLVAFDAHQHQAGFAPDRRSRLMVVTADGTARELVLDRAAGVVIEGTTLFQAMPTGVAVVLELPGEDFRAIHLQSKDEQLAEVNVTLPGGGQARFVVEAERPFDDRRGSGPLTVRFERDGVVTEVSEGDTVDFGNSRAVLVDLVLWSGFTYVRSPGIPAVFVGFAALLAACALLTFPSGVVRLDHFDGSTLARVWLNRGSAVLASAWQQRTEESSLNKTTGPPRTQEDSSWLRSQ